MTKTNPHFPIEVALPVAFIGFLEAILRLGPRLLGARAQTLSFWLLGAGLLALCTLLPWERKRARRVLLYAGLLLCTFGVVYATSWWLWGVLLTPPGYTLGAAVTYTFHFLAGKDMDNFGQPPASPLGKAGPPLVGILGVVLLVWGAARLLAGVIPGLF